MRQSSQSAVALVLAWGLLACGGGGSDTSPPPLPVDPGAGLQQKPALTGLRFPGNTVDSGDLRIVKAFPNLSFTAPLWFGQAPGDARRAYVAEQGGRVWVFDFNAGVSQKSLFLDLTDRTRANGEQGLLGFAFHPDFASNRLVYAYYSKNANPAVEVGNHTLARFTVSADGLSADRASGTVLLNEPDPFQNHNGGALLFGPDGLLYLAIGDGGSGGDPQNNGQNLNTVMGKILRLRPDGTIPPDNPFAAQSGRRGEIWAYGLRNPYRMSFDRGTGQLWAGDVGQNIYEEINVITRGGNYGWRLREGAHDFNTSDPRPATPPIDPLFEYNHDGGRCSITGGVVYRGAALPTLAGQYLYGDFCSGTVWALRHENGARVLGNAVLGSVPNPSSFGEDAAGEVYLTAYDGFVYRIEPNASGGAAFPQRLSQTGLFTDTATLRPNPGLVEYEVNAPFYSDGSRKRRWFGIPPDTSVTFSATEQYRLPVGAATVKHFEITQADGRVRRLETRVFLHQAEGWQGYTYRWNAAGTDADLLADAQTEILTVRTEAGTTRTQKYEYPSRAACLNCHTAAAGVPLGLRTAQLNRNQTYGTVTDNQLRAYNAVRLFDRDIGPAAQYPVQTNPADTSATLSARARSYLDVNCSQCHRPGGPTGSDMDLRLSTPIGDTRTVGVAPSGGDLGIAGAQRIKAGNKAQSLVWERMRRLDSNRMPPIGSHVVDDAGLALIGQWIDAGAN